VRVSDLTTAVRDATAFRVWILDLARLVLVGLRGRENSGNWRGSRFNAPLKCVPPIAALAITIGKHHLYKPLNRKPLHRGIAGVVASWRLGRFAAQQQ
jgi:hypothetical protein